MGINELWLHLMLNKQTNFINREMANRRSRYKKALTAFFSQDKQMQQKTFSRLNAQTQILPPLLSVDTLRL